MKEPTEFAKQFEGMRTDRIDFDKEPELKKLFEETARRDRKSVV